MWIKGTAYIYTNQLTTKTTIIDHDTSLFIDNNFVYGVNCSFQCKRRGTQIKKIRRDHWQNLKINAN